MRCSECNEPIRPVVALDIDGTMGDYHTHLIKFLENYTGQKVTHPFNEALTPMREWAWDALDLTEAEWRDAKLAYRQGGMKRSMPVMPYAAEMTWRLSEVAEVWVTTTRPYLRLDNVDPDTREWLRRNHIQFKGLLYDENKYVRLAEIVGPERVVAVLDDLPEMIEQAKMVFNNGVPIHRENDYNMPYEIGCTSVASLREATTLITRRIEEWNKTK